MKTNTSSTSFYNLSSISALTGGGPGALRAVGGLTPTILVVFFYEAAYRSAPHTPFPPHCPSTLSSLPTSGLRIKPSTNHSFSPSPANTTQGQTSHFPPRKALPSLCCKIVGTLVFPDFRSRAQAWMRDRAVWLLGSFNIWVTVPDS